MPTIALYANKINQMPRLIQDVKKSVVDYQSELSALKKQSLKINQSICNLSDVINSIQASSQTQEQKIASLETFQQNSEQFIEDTARIDSDVANVINQRKNDFYEEYYYLKPECEKNGWEKFCDGVKAVGEWCKENWKSIAKIVLTVVIIAALGIASVLTGGALAVILAGAFWGALAGGLIGGVMGGVTSVINGGSFLEGFADGALSGAVTGAITGAACAGIGVAGQAFGKGVSCLSKLGQTIKVTSKVTKVISLGLDGFDMAAMGIGFFDPDNPLVQINQKLHSSAAYNVFQVGVNALAIFTGAASSTMKCFVAGTMVLTASGLVAIENIKAGDKVISTDPETFEAAEKTVLETYVREDNKLIHLIINGEEIVTTGNHPFYVQGRGFIKADSLLIEDKLISVSGEDLIIEDYSIETIEKPVSVYNFQVEDFHTYFVGNCAVWVHNDCTIEFSNKSGLDQKEFKEQLSDQQKGLGDLTIDEYKNNRQAFNERKTQTGSGRDPNSAKYQASAREEAINAKIKQLRKQGYSKNKAELMAKDWAKGKAALHGPDQIVGGYANNFSGLGDSKINSSIGSQWKSRVSKLDDYINEQAASYLGTTKLSELGIKFVLI